eukprot:13933436-Ditylum_brightwellii.AAC.1
MQSRKSSPEYGGKISSSHPIHQSKSIQHISLGAQLQLSLTNGSVRFATLEVTLWAAGYVTTALTKRDLQHVGNSNGVNSIKRDM